MWLRKQYKVQKRPNYIIDIILFKRSELHNEQTFDSGDEGVRG